MIRRRSPFVLSALLVSGVASADTYYPEGAPPQSPLPPPPPEPPLAPPSFVQPVMVPMPMPMPDPEQGPKSPGTATLLSLAATVAPSLVAVSVFPDRDRVGNDDHEEAMLWVLAGSALLGPSVGHWYSGKVVTPGLGVRALGFALGAAAFGSNDFDEALGLLALGSTAILGGAIYDIATAGRSAREFNFEHATHTIPMVVPTVGPDGRAQVRVGLTGSF